MRYGFIRYKEGIPTIEKEKTISVLSNRLFLEAMKEVIRYTKRELLDEG